MDTYFLLISLVPLALATILFCTATLAYKWYQLRDVPGPFLASLSNFWLAYQLRIKRQSFKHLVKVLHAKYGPVVRYGPKRVATGDASAIQTIYGVHPVFNGGDSYKVLTATTNGKEITTIVTLRDEKRHARVKSAIAGGFTPNAVHDHEDEIDAVVAQLLQQLKAHGPEVNIHPWLHYFGLDASAMIAFSEDLGAIRTGSDPSGVLAAGQTRFFYWFTWFSTPWLERMLYKNRLYLSWKKPSSTLAILAMKQIQKRKSMTDTEKAESKTRDLLATYLEAQAKNPTLLSMIDIVGITISTLNAGADTVALTSFEIIKQICKNPVSAEKLYAELRDANLCDPPKANELKALPYLDAFMRESARLGNSKGMPLERIVPVGGATISGFRLPGGTTVCASESYIGQTEAIYGPKTEEFRPERWIEAGEEQQKKMVRSDLTFGAGKRQCLGQHIAWMELRKLVAGLMINFEVSMA